MPTPRYVPVAVRDDGRHAKKHYSAPFRRFDAKQVEIPHLCARGDMENRIKEQQLDLFADRTSSHTMRANQLRLYFASFAYVLMHSLRRQALVGTSWARMQCGTLRVKLLKIAARVRITARKVWLSFSSVYPYRAEFAAAAAALCLRPSRAPPT